MHVFRDFWLTMKTFVFWSFFARESWEIATNIWQVSYYSSCKIKLIMYFCFSNIFQKHFFLGVGIPKKRTIEVASYLLHLFIEYWMHEAPRSLDILESKSTYKGKVILINLKKFYIRIGTFLEKFLVFLGRHYDSCLFKKFCLKVVFKIKNLYQKISQLELSLIWATYTLLKKLPEISWKCMGSKSRQIVLHAYTIYILNFQQNYLYFSNIELKKRKIKEFFPISLIFRQGFGSENNSDKRF